MNIKLVVITAIIGLNIVACSSGTSSPLIPLPTPGGYTPTPVPSSGNNLHIQITPGGTCGTPNLPCATVTICQPGTTNCDTVNNILVDTGSFGLRVFGSLLPNTGSSLTPMESGGLAVAECVSYADLTSNWGPVVYANVTLNTLTTTSPIPIQVLNANFVGADANCPNAVATPTEFGINGILGIGPLNTDQFGTYYTCDSTSCNSLDTPPAFLTNPVTMFSPGNNNGLTLTFAPVPSNGATGADGYAIFGVGSNTSNTPNAGTLYKAFQIESSNNLAFNVDSVFSSTAYPSFLDTGSNYFFLPEGSFPDCGGTTPGLFCPSSNTSESATMVGTNGFGLATSTLINFNISNANSLLASNNTAFSNLGGSFMGLDAIDWGLPFYLGRTVYVVFANTTATINGTTLPASPNGYWIY